VGFFGVGFLGGCTQKKTTGFFGVCTRVSEPWFACSYLHSYLNFVQSCIW